MRSSILFDGRLPHYARFAWKVARTEGLLSLFRRVVKRVTRPDALRPMNSPLVDDIGAVLAPRPPSSSRSIGIPLRHVDARAFAPVAVMVHCFYPELLGRILARLHHIPAEIGLFITTDTEEKRATILADVERSGLKLAECSVKVMENRGRDIAPRLLGFADVYDRYELFLHLHTKKSPHGGDLYASWFDYLLDHLIGSQATARSSLVVLTHDNVGVVFPEHISYVKAILNWGHDFAHASALLKRMGITLRADHILEFPSGSMFWGRSAALRPLLRAGLQAEDFEEERGQVDGTLAHAIERSILMVAEHAGFRWARVRVDEQTGDAPSDVESLVAGCFLPLLDSWRIIPPRVTHAIPETLRILALPTSGRKRLNLVVPTLDPAQIYGGISTALSIFSQLRRAAGVEWDARVLVTDTPVLDKLPSDLADFTISKLGKGVPGAGRLQVVDCTDRIAARLEVTPHDVFIPTAWWTAQQALELIDYQRAAFGASYPMLYLLQDFEPGFYGWSTRYALADATYHRPDATLAIINSEELWAFMSARYAFLQSYTLAYKALPALKEPVRQNGSREKILLFYSRPTAQRNCFELGVDALRAWQMQHPAEATSWSIQFVGEGFDPVWVAGIANASVRGKLPLEDYVNLLERARVGVSLMISPHPSYPPLEMAAAGLVTITNKFGTKDLSARSPHIISLDQLSVASISEAIHEATVRSECLPARSPDPDSVLQAPVTEAVRFDPALILEDLNRLQWQRD